MAEVISIQDHTLAGLNFATKNVAENKKLFEAKLETWLHRYRHLSTSRGDGNRNRRQEQGQRQQQW